MLTFVRVAIVFPMLIYALRSLATTRTSHPHRVCIFPVDRHCVVVSSTSKQMVRWSTRWTDSLLLFFVRSSFTSSEKNTILLIVVNVWQLWFADRASLRVLRWKLRDREWVAQTVHDATPTHFYVLSIHWCFVFIQHTQSSERTFLERRERSLCNTACTLADQSNQFEIKITLK